MNADGKTIGKGSQDHELAMQACENFCDINDAALESQTWDLDEIGYRVLELAYQATGRTPRQA